MQVDRQPGPWPYAAILAGLLLLCLMAPHYWHNTPSLEYETIGAPVGVASGVSETGPNWNADARILPSENFARSSGEIGNVGAAHWAGAANADPLNLWSAPTIDQLIAGPGTNQVPGAWNVHRTNESHEWPLLLQPTTASSLAAQSNVENPMTPEASAAMRLVGSAFAGYLPLENVPSRLVVLGGQLRELLTTLPAAEAASPQDVARRWTVRILSPDDRLAMLPAPRELDPSHPWCLPQVLFELLDRLAAQPDSAQWASHVTNQLHLLTDRERLEGDDIQAILADLSDAAHESMRMADETDNDRLRVELLRTHWALARRLDCWGAMHEKRVAERFTGRVAARGPLSLYFDGTSGQTPASTDISALSGELEKYETGRDPKVGRYVAQQQRRLKSSADAVDRELADAMEQHYRNANVRVAITAGMLNRLVGEERNESRAVRDNIAGAFVHGQSNVWSQSHVFLDPSADDWQLELTAKGVVESSTVANGGPVQFRSRGTTDFSGHKTVVVDDKGIRLQQSKVDATSSNRLVGVTTDYDWAPIVGSYTRDRAIKEYRTRQSRVRSQIEMRVASQAEDTLDQETQKAVDQIRQQTYDRFASQLDEFGIKLTPVEMKTTPDRLVARLRIAGEKQLGSHTPRPRALSDSLASAQIHETALTNLAVTLGLDGKRFTAPELQKMLREKFSQVASKSPVEARQDTVFQFAPADSVQIHINNGKLELTVAFSSIEFEKNAMRDVVVHANYLPKVNGLNAEFVRDGSLGIEGRFSSTERARLHNVFNCVFSPERHLPIVRIANPHEKQFEGLMITQLVLEDGWIGLAVGPTCDHRVAERSRSLR